MKKSLQIYRKRPALSRLYVDEVIRRALKEDAADKDITTRILIPAAHKSCGRIVAREDAVFCGAAFAKAAFRQLDNACRIKITHEEGDRVKTGTTVMSLTGPTRALLSAERVALNLLGHLSGIASKTAAFVNLCRPYRPILLDTRKTLPGLRSAQRWAVICGGGRNHRFDLSEMVMIKDNHRLVCRNRETLFETAHKIREKVSVPIEVEVDSLEELRDVLPACPDIILLDNMTPAQIRKAVTMLKGSRSRPLLEASGGITERTIKRYAATGVDRISLGALTHSVKAIDYSLEIETT